MAQNSTWFWDDTNKLWVKAQCDAAGKLLISDVDPFTVQQTTPMNLRHVPHGYYAVGNSYLPYAVDSAGKLLLSIAALQHLSDIADVNLTGLADGDFIYYDSGSATWKRIAHKDATTGVHGVGTLGFKINSKALTFDRILTAASGDVSYAGAGFQPTALIVLFTVPGTPIAGVAFSDSLKGGYGWTQLTDGTTQWSGMPMIALTTSDYQYATVKSYDTDGFTLTWVKGGSPTGTAKLMFLCLR